jgi:membrane-bound lytic murein transglycosylase A
MEDAALSATSFGALPGWREDDPTALLAPMRRCLAHARAAKPYRTGSLGIRPEELHAIFDTASDADFASPDAARRFLERNFTPFRIVPKSGKPGLLTGFYEPVVEVSSEPTDEFRFPFHRRPADLVDIDDTNRPDFMDLSYAFGRKTVTGIDFFPDRQAIDSGALNGQGLEIAWARSRVDVFFAHVQGAARLVFPDGSLRRVTYAAKAGHPFSGIGRHLIDIGEIPENEISMASIRRWLADHPERVDEIFWHNRSYIFFREAPVDDDRLGPVAAAKVPLEPMRSIAVDKTIHTFSSLIHIHSDSLRHLSEGKPFARTMIALDTGTAIVGAEIGRAHV